MRKEEHVIVRFAAEDYHTQQMFREHNLMPLFFFKVPVSSKLTHRTMHHYFKNALNLASCSQVRLRGIRDYTDIFANVPV
jgi:hypothetical protein